MSPSKAVWKPCRGHCGQQTTGERCKGCAAAVRNTKRKTPMPTGTKEWNQTFTHGPRTKFGKDTKPAGCGFSWWADKVCQEDPALFYAANRERALALRGQGHSE
jgi:hypothetical protein